MPVDYSSLTRRSRPTARRLILIGGLLIATSAAAVLVLAPGGETPPAAAPTATITPPDASTHAALTQAPPAAGPDESAAQVKTDAVSAAAPAAATAPADPWVTAIVAKGQTLSTLFTKYGLSPRAWIPVINAGGDAHQLRHLKVGAKLHLKIQDNQLEAVRYAFDPTHTLYIERSGDSFKAHTEVAELTRKRVVAHGTITSSLFVDGENAGLSDRQIMAFSHIFAYDVNFAEDIHPGDHFTVIYNQVYKDGKKFRRGNILAAEIQTNGHDYRAVRYTAKNGEATFYTPSGHSLHREFLRTPVSYTRISSKFSYARMNPVLHVVRPHYGTDFAAPMGTPIHATAKGRIAFIGSDGGYGNCIKIRTGSRYETIYGHMSHFRHGLHRGSRVKQGEVIGYVGMTGLATGPHVHYEIRVNGKPRNPMTIKLPNGPALPSHALARFKQQTTPLVAALDHATTRRYAANGPAIGTR